MNENIEFLQAFIKNPLKVGSITPSSPELARKMLEGLAPNDEKIILELGVGTGAVTKFLTEIVHEPHSYLGIELDRKLVKCLQKNFPDLQFVDGNASEAFEIHRKSGLGRVGYIVSGLPFVSLSKETNQYILEELDKFMELGCLFRTFQYAHTYNLPQAIKFRREMERRYGKKQKSKLIVKNVPPAYTLTWKTF